MTPAHECLYDVAWQRLRLRVAGGWATEEETRESISRLLAYVGRAEGRYWKFIRVWRCINLIATAEQRAAADPQSLRLIKVFKRGLELEFNRYKHAQTGVVFKGWNWAKVSLDLTKLYEDDREVFNQLLAYSEGRLRKRNVDNPELARFVRMTRDVVFDRG